MCSHAEMCHRPFEQNMDFAFAPVRSTRYSPPPAPSISLGAPHIHSLLSQKPAGSDGQQPSPRPSSGLCRDSTVSTGHSHPELFNTRETVPPHPVPTLFLMRQGRSSEERAAAPFLSPTGPEVCAV